MLEFLQIFTFFNVLSYIGAKLALLVIAISVIRRIFGLYIGLAWHRLLAFINRDDARRVSPNFRLVLITGCDTGFGKAAAEHLHDIGFAVIAFCLDPENASKSDGFSSRINDPTFKLVQLDVTDQAKINQAVENVRNWLTENPNYHLWALINNSGVMQAMVPFEFLSLESTRRVFEVNVFGTMRVTKAFLPLLRKERGSRIVVTSSLAAEVPPVSYNMATYCATKAAVLAAFDVLRCEVNKFGIYVSAICPDYFRTEIANPERNVKAFDVEWSQAEPEIVDAYGGPAFGKRLRTGIEASVTMARSDLSPVVNAFSEAVTAVHPKRRYFPLTSQSNWIKILYKISPKSVDNMCARIN